jgi:hypothetical protein
LSTADVGGELHYKEIDIAQGATVNANLVCDCSRMGETKKEVISRT